MVQPCRPWRWALQNHGWDSPDATSLHQLPPPSCSCHLRSPKSPTPPMPPSGSYSHPSPKSWEESGGLALREPQDLGSGDAPAPGSGRLSWRDTPGQSLEKTSRSGHKPLTQALEVLLDGYDLLLIIGLG